MCVVAGVLTIALPVPVIVTNFNTVYKQATQRKIRAEIIEEKGQAPRSYFLTELSSLN